MDKEGKNVGMTLFSTAKQWFLSQADKQTKINKEENISSPNQSNHSELSFSKSDQSFFNESNRLRQRASVKCENNLGNEIEFIPKTNPTARSFKKDDALESVGLNIKSSKSVGCLQASKTSLVPKWVDIPKITINQKSETEKKVQDASHCCPTCGQQWPRDKPKISASNLKVSQWDCLPHNDIEKKSKSPLLSSKNDYMSGLKRSSSFVHKGRSQTQNNSRSSRVIKAASLMNDPIRPWTHSESKFRHLASKESTKSAPSLKRCLSYNVDSFRSARGDTGEDGNSINYSKEQRSFLRRDTSCENDTGCEETASCPGSEYDDIIKYSPKLTKETKYVNGCPLDEFKTIFDAESFRIPSIYGQLKIMFQLFNDTNEFQVTILEGSNVAVENESGNIGIYTKICLMPGKLQKKTGRDKHSTRNPVFYESFIFKTSLAQLLESQLKIKLYNKPGILSIPEPIGQCAVPLYNYDLTAVNVIWQNLQKCKGQKDDMDEFDFSYFERDKVKKKRQFGKFLCGNSSPE